MPKKEIQDLIKMIKDSDLPTKTKGSLLNLFKEKKLTYKSFKKIREKINNLAKKTSETIDLLNFRRDFLKDPIRAVEQARLNLK